MGGGGMFSAVKILPTTKPALHCPPNQFFLLNRHNNFYAKESSSNSRKSSNSSNSSSISSDSSNSNSSYSSKSSSNSSSSSIELEPLSCCPNGVNSALVCHKLFGPCHLADCLYAHLLMYYHCYILCKLHFFFSFFSLRPNLADRLCGARRLALEYGKPQSSPSVSHCTLHTAHCTLHTALYK